MRGQSVARVCNALLQQQQRRLPRHSAIKAGRAAQDLLLGGRQELLDRLRSIYEERSQLNQITMSIMLPRRSLDSDGDKDCGTTEGKIKKAARYGAGCMLSQTAELVTALDRLKANLSSERRMLVQLHASLVRKVRSCRGAVRDYSAPVCRIF